MVTYITCHHSTIPTIGSNRWSCDHHSNHRIQRGDRGVQEPVLHRVGRGRPGQDPPPVAPLLPGNQWVFRRQLSIKTGCWGWGQKLGTWKLVDWWLCWVVAQGFEIAYSKAICCPSKWDAAVILNLPHMDPHNYFLIEGSLEVKLPTIWTDEKQSRAEAERRERWEERRSEEKESEERRCRCAKR